MAEVIPVGYRVLIEPFPVKEKVGKIIVVTEDVRKLEEAAQIKGTVLAIGPDCWKEHTEPFAKIGDVVLYQRHSGMRLTDDFGNIRMDRLLLNDTDITARVVVDTPIEE